MLITWGPCPSKGTVHTTTTYKCIKTYLGVFSRVRNHVHITWRMTLSASISSKPAVLSLEFSCEEVEMVVYFKIYFMIHFPRKTPGGVFDRCFCVPSWGAFWRERRTCRATNTCLRRHICRHLHKPRDQWAKKQTDRRSHQYCST